MPMNIVNCPQNQQQVGANGECPHCSPTISYFRPVASHATQLPNGLQGLISAAQCESCKGFVLVVGQKSPNQVMPAKLKARKTPPPAAPVAIKTPWTIPGLGGLLRDKLRTAGRIQEDMAFPTGVEGLLVSRLPKW